MHFSLCPTFPSAAPHLGNQISADLRALLLLLLLLLLWLLLWLLLLLAVYQLCPMIHAVPDAPTLCAFVLLVHRHAVQGCLHTHRVCL